MTYQCPRCIERGQTWNGDPPRCGFDENGNFIENNWNCATLNALRELAEENAVFSDSHQQSISVIQKYDVGHGILSWYKSRGRTDDFRDTYFEGTLRYAQQLLGDVDPDDPFEGLISIGED
jgi:hypothetical protein